MQNLIVTLLALIGTFFVFVLGSLVGTTAGAFVGLVVGYFFPGTVGLIGSAITGGALIPGWQVGAILGFVGGFFKSRLNVSND